MTVYCANQFCGEFDILELKLETLSPLVDKFIISEGTKTHSGKDKPLYYLENYLSSN
jgi:beta-1,4-mannosyl-glycoprotein beta-1,4-N-acetylglucosaminyltransferase